MTRTSLGTGMLFVAAALLSTGAAEAQTTGQTKTKRGETVLTRARPEVDPLGIRVGSFFLFPKLTLEETYNDNIYATNDNETDDFITNIRPEVSLNSDWANHALTLAAGLDQGLYFSNDEADYTDWFTRATGRLDVTRDINIEGGAGFKREHEDPDDPNFGGSEYPENYYQTDAFLRYNQQIGRFRTTVDGTFARLDYENAIGGVQNQDRDINVFQGGVRVGYEFQPQYQAFVRASGNRREYDTTPDDEGRTRDSSGYAIVGGLAVDLTGVLFGDVFVGYREQFYDDSDEDDFSGPTFGLSLGWNVTPLTTITARVEQTVQETTENNASAYVLTLGSLSVDHELLRNLLLNANASVGEEDYEGTSQTDMIFAAGAGIRYLMNRHFYASLAYRYSSRDGDNSNDDFSQNLIRIGLEGQF
ncbi:MAG: outer membrane beta-barrel protein [Defluviicoccus sp.]